ncbi:MAG: hypothetical protein WBO45_20895 [Planctomycetota bacterium]
MNDDSPRTALRTGLWLLAVSLPLGLTLEALHAWKVPVYLGSALRRELWTLAHAHGNLLGILCLVMAAVAPRLGGDAAATRRRERLLAVGACTMPLGFLLAGVLNSEGDPSFAIALVPVGGVLVFVALVQAARGAVARGE